MPKEKPSVLVVGAGPTGLMAACQLAIQGIPFRIVEKNTAANTESRALVLHARTLEIFEQMGIADAAVELGERCRGVTWMFNGKEAASMKIEGEDLTPYPYILCLEQSKTESLLINFLAECNIAVERGIELISYTTDEKNGVTATLKKSGDTAKTSEGSEETFTVGYLIGADGAHSTVREKMGLALEGQTYPQILFVIDCQVDADIRPNEIYLMATKKGLTGFFPMVQSHSGNHRYRVLGVLPEKSEAVTFEEIEKDFADRVEMPAKIHDPAWISIYHAHHRHAKEFRLGRCFIAGDAAHIHSPVGGQGMNTGIQDAYNLVWKLALVIQGAANDALLDTYNDERIVVAKQLVKTTDKVFYMAAGEKPLIKGFRLNVMPFLLRAVNFLMAQIKSSSQEVFRVMSQIGIQYRNSALSQLPSKDIEGTFAKNAPKAGDRMPSAIFINNGQKANIQYYLKGPGFHALIFGRMNDPDQKAKQEMLALIQSNISPMIKNIKEHITLHYIPYNSDTAGLYKALGVEQTAYFIVRPDMYIAYRSTHLVAV